MTQNYTLERNFADSLTDDELIPSDIAQRQTGFNLKFIIAGATLIALIISLIVYGSMTASSYYLTVSEIQEASQSDSASMVGQRIRVNGAVMADSEDWNAQEITLRFSIEDENGATLPIVFYGPRPDNFQRAASAIVEGELLADGSFQADTLLLKCPSRYEEEPEEIFVQSTR
jgi:cytochrome c-type biogenesis protein CcmE